MNVDHYSTEWRGKKFSSRRQGLTQKMRSQAEDGFFCSRCHAYVSSAVLLSGVGNRNHCPYCLCSRHVDLLEAGDRLSACKSVMQPVGLTVKASGKKYGSSRGELMLVHRCTGCGVLSINRIAADDDTALLLDIFESSLGVSRQDVERIKLEGVYILGAEERHLVCSQLFGR